eukprot:g5621.t1
MQYVGYAELAAAVSNAGGLGTISALTQKVPENLKAEIRKYKALSKKPFAVNFTILPAMVTPNYQEMVQAAIDEGVKIIQTAGRSPDSIKLADGRNLMQMMKEANLLVIHKCMSVRHALTAERIGVDCISLGGFDYGGHSGNDGVTHWVHAPTAARKLKIPYLIAGGTTVGDQLAGALAMGASGVEIGTGFMATKESSIHQKMKERIADPQTDERSTILILQSVNNTGRFYKNPVTSKVAEIEQATPGDFSKIAHLMTGKRNLESLQVTGDPDNSAWTMGMGAGLINGIPTVEEFITEMVNKAEETIKSQMNLIVGGSRL